MGCIASKHSVSVTPAFDNSASSRDHGGIFSSLLPTSRSKHFAGESDRRREHGFGPEKSKEESSRGRWDADEGSLSFMLSRLHRHLEAEQVAAGWPAWLSAAAGEAIQGWVPLKADSFQKLEKIGQGTYSSVFRARHIDTGKIVALKKVHFDNFEPESVRFMAREIQILRKLDHPNVVKLEGLIASRLSSSIYFVFEYMEHDLAGLLASPEIKFSESQVKCYVYQLLSGLGHCHSRGVMHRDIKGANLLVNDEGILKIADFGLANFLSPGQGLPLTSRVVTLWYRPPELLLGSTNYLASVDLWSVGCVFAELLIGKPILRGRTEVEQLHKIFKLCGSPPEDYWKKSKFPHATMFRPQHTYQSTLKQTFKDMPATTFSLIETLLSVEPFKRGTALSALKSEYFMTKPYACDPSSLPKYPPSKEIDAKIREESHRKGMSGRGHGSRATRRPRACKLELKDPCRFETCIEEPQTNSHGIVNDNLKVDIANEDGKTRFLVDLQPMPQIIAQDEPHCAYRTSPRQIPFSGPLQLSTSIGFTWAKKRGEESISIKSNDRHNLKCGTSNTSVTSQIHTRKIKTTATAGLEGSEHDQALRNDQISSGDESCKITEREPLKQWVQLQRPHSFAHSGISHSQQFLESFCLDDEMPSNRNILGHRNQEEDKVEFSGPLFSQSHKVDELLAKHERHIRHTMRRSWFQRDRTHGK